jgi:hypothetical protein
MLHRTFTVAATTCLVLDTSQSVSKDSVKMFRDLQPYIMDSNIASPSNTHLRMFQIRTMVRLARNTASAIESTA